MATQLKISDLSVGDWVMLGGKNYQIYHLTLAGDVYGYRRTNNSFTGEEYYDGEIGDVQTIPITAEILEANGLFRHEVDANNPKRVVLSNYFMLARSYTDVDWWRVLIYDDEMPSRELFNGRVYYVHQLQHALRLAGVEKEINLPTT